MQKQKQSYKPEAADYTANRHEINLRRIHIAKGGEPSGVREEREKEQERQRKRRRDGETERRNKRKEGIYRREE